MKRILFLITLLICVSSSAFADDFLPQFYTPNNLNPYKTNKWLDFLSFNNNAYKPKFESDTRDYGKYNYLLSRLEKEWFNKNFSDNILSERLERLEEHAFGTSFNEDIEKRCDRLKRVFNAQKTQASSRKSLFSGVPTSIPFGIDELVSGSD